MLIEALLSLYTVVCLAAMLPTASRLLPEAQAHSLTLPLLLLRKVKISRADRGLEPRKRWVCFHVHRSCVQAYAEHYMRFSSLAS